MTKLCPIHVSIYCIPRMCKLPVCDVFLFFPFTVEKMKMIDKEYVSPGSSGEHLFSSQSKLDSYRREIESQTQTEMNIKVCSFYDSTAA